MGPDTLRWTLKKESGPFYENRVLTPFLAGFDRFSLVTVCLGRAAPDYTARP